MSLLSTLFGNYNNNKATTAANKGTQQGIDTIKGFYGDTKVNLNPFIQTGTQANGVQSQMMGGDYSGFYNSPDFQGAMKAGGQMVDNSAASRGGLFGGGNQRALSDYGQQTATQYLGNYRDWIGGVSGQGQQAATGLGAFGAQAGNGIAQLYGDMGLNNANKYNARSKMYDNFESSIAKLFGMG